MTNEIRRDLDICAARANAARNDGATMKQTSFLASLMARCGDTADDIDCGQGKTHATLTRSTASNLIGLYLDKSKDMPRPPVPTNITISLKPVVEMLHTAQAHLKWPKIRFDTANIRLSVAGPRARFPGTVNVTSNGGYGESEFYGRVHLDGTFEASRHVNPEVEGFLSDLAHDPEGVVRESGKNTGHCCFCHKTLTDKRSREVGYGPVCASHFNLPH